MANPFDLWDKIAADPRYAGMNPNEQSTLKTNYFRDYVLPHPGIKPHLNEPGYGAQLQHSFFAPEEQRSAMLTQKAAQLADTKWWQVPLTQSIPTELKSLFTGKEQPLVSSAEDIPQDFLGGYGKGAAKFGESLATPTNVALMLGMGPAGRALGSGVEAVAAARGAAQAANIGVRATQLFHSAANLGFSTQMVGGMIKSAPAAYEAWNLMHKAEASGDNAAADYYSNNLHQQLTELGLTGLATALGAKGGFSEGKAGLTGEASAGQFAALKRLNYTPDEIKALTPAAREAAIAKKVPIRLGNQAALSGEQLTRATQQVEGQEPAKLTAAGQRRAAAKLAKEGRGQETAQALREKQIADLKARVADMEKAEAEKKAAAPPPIVPKGEPATAPEAQPAAAETPFREPKLPPERRMAPRSPDRDRVYELDSILAEDKKSLAGAEGEDRSYLEKRIQQFTEIRENLVQSLRAKPKEGPEAATPYPKTVTETPSAKEELPSGITLTPRPPTEGELLFKQLKEGQAPAGSVQVPVPRPGQPLDASTHTAAEVAAKSPRQVEQPRTLPPTDAFDNREDAVTAGLQHWGDENKFVVGSKTDVIGRTKYFLQPKESVRGREVVAPKEVKAPGTAKQVAPPKAAEAPAKAGEPVQATTEPQVNPELIKAKEQLAQLEAQKPTEAFPVKPTVAVEGRAGVPEARPSGAEPLDAPSVYAVYSRLKHGMRVDPEMLHRVAATTGVDSLEEIKSWIDKNWEKEGELALEKPAGLRQPGMEAPMLPNGDTNPDLLAIARRHIENAAGELGISYRGDMAGLALWQDHTTGSTLAEDVSLITPERIREKTELSRKNFESKGSYSQLPLAKRIAVLAERTQDWIKKQPTWLQHLVTMSQGRADRVVATHIDPLAHQALEKLGGYLVPRRPLDVRPGLLGSTQIREMPDGTWNVTGRVAVTARGLIQRLAQDRSGLMSISHTFIHELGHYVQGKIGTFAQGLKYDKYYPKAVAEMTQLYGRAGVTPRRLQSEIFAQSFYHWYMGDETPTSKGFESVLKSNETVWDAIKDLKGRGKQESWRSGPSPVEILYRAGNKDPMLGFDLINPLRQFAGTIEKSKEAMALLIKELGITAAYHAHWTDTFKDIAARQKKFSAQDLMDFSDSVEGKPGAKPLDAIDQVGTQQISAMWQQLWDGLKRIKPDKFYGEGIENYFGRMWKNPRSADIAKQLWLARRPLEGRKGFTKHRMYEFASDAMRAGAEPYTNNWYETQMHVMNEVRKYIAAHAAKNEGQNIGGIVWARDSERGTKIPANWVPGPDKIFTPKAFVNGATVEYGRYYMSPEYAKVFSNYLEPGLAGKPWYDFSRGLGNTLNQFQLAVPVIHGTVVTLVSTISDVGLGMQRLTKGNFLGAGASFGRAAIPFASIIDRTRIGRLMNQEVKLYGPESPNLSAMTRSYIEAGGRFGLDPFMKNDNISKFWSAMGDKKYFKAAAHSLPALIQKTSRPLMEYAIPWAKAGAYARIAEDRITELNKSGADKTTQLVELNKVAKHLDYVYGQMVYDNYFMNRTAKDCLMLGFRSVGWNWGDAAVLGEGVKDIASNLKAVAQGRATRLTENSAFLPALVMTTAFYGAVAGLLMGHPPKESTDYFHPQAGELRADGTRERIQPLTYMKDYQGFAHAPITTTVHKMNPALLMAYELANNEDFYGTEIYHPGDPYKAGLPVSQAADAGKFILKNLVPILGSNVEKLRDEGASWPKAIALSSVATPAPAWVGQTPASETAYRLEQSNLKKGPRTQEAFEHQRLVARLRNQYNQDRITLNDLFKAMDRGDITETEFDHIDEDKGLSGFERAIKRAGAQDFIEILRKANPAEKNIMRQYVDNKLDEIDKMEKPLEYKGQMVQELEDRLK